ncbi:MAG: acyl-CoA dehydrogenase, partial [Actinobacteria bacterium]|nr:acyl-CoA dehydrogenase [Actinomycetota bacterium]
MVFTLAAEQRALSLEVRELAARELHPIAEGGAAGRVNRELIRAMGRFGLLDRLFPGLAAGQQPRLVSATEFCLLWESLATESTQAGAAFALQGTGSYPLLEFGQPEQVQRWLPAVAAGEAVPGIALSEPDAVTDAGALQLTARPEGDGWLLSGEKTWIPNAPEADFYTVFARTEPGQGSRGLTAFLVPAIRPGLSGESVDMVSPHSLGTLTFDSVPVTGDDLLGTPGQGFEVALRTVAATRPSVGACAVGIAEAALEATIAYAGAQVTAGKPLREHQTVAHLLADMATRTEAARLLVYAAAAAADSAAGTAAVLAAMAKLLATESAQFVVDSAVQVHGPHALERGHLLEHLAREVRAWRLYDANETRSVITDSLRDSDPYHTELPGSVPPESDPGRDRLRSEPDGGALREPGDSRSGDGNSGAGGSGDRNSGDGNSGCGSSGCGSAGYGSSGSPGEGSPGEGSPGDSE